MSGHDKEKQSQKSAPEHGKNDRKNKVNMLNGLFVPQFTAFNADNSVDYKATQAHGKWLVDNNVSGLVPFGTFGEGASLSLREKEKVTIDLLEVIGDASLIPTLICNSLGEIEEFLSFAEDLPLAGIMVIPPSYFKNATDETLIEFYNVVTSKTSHKIIAYNIPAFSLKISPEVVAKVPVWGVKDSSGDINSTQRYRNLNVRVLIGSDSLLTQAIQLGASGGICGIANCFPSQMRSVYELSTTGKVQEAEALLASIMDVVDPLLQGDLGLGGAIGVLKSFAHSVIPNQVGRMRLPVETLQPSTSSLNESIARAKALAE
jgi:4-hydroxy-tetrahydrodipicolinate synthase